MVRVATPEPPGGAFGTEIAVMVGARLASNGRAITFAAPTRTMKSSVAS